MLTASGDAFIESVSAFTRLFCAASLVFGIGSTPLPASTLVLDPLSGSISGQAGQNIGWGFTLTSLSTTDWISVTSSALTFETNPSLGTYTDFIGLQGGPSPAFAIAPLAAWTEVFDGVTQGIGAYLLDSGAIPFSQNTGQVLVSFDTYDDDPSNGGQQTGSSSFSVPFSVTVDAPAAVPEPSTLGLAALAVLALAFRAFRVRYS
ncbi:MAG: PEP-CTERM sorting domain-containing protein [Bryobacteraceae bacterium]